MNIMDITTYSKIKKMSLQLLVTDIDRSIEFYTKKLGFEIDFRYEDFYAGIIKDGFSIHFKTGNPLIEERKSKRHNEDIDIIFSVEDIEYLYEEFSGQPIEIIQPLRDMPYGKEFYITDPDAYSIGFIEEA